MKNLTKDQIEEIAKWMRDWINAYYKIRDMGIEKEFIERFGNIDEPIEMPDLNVRINEAALSDDDLEKIAIKKYQTDHPWIPAGESIRALSWVNGAIWMRDKIFKK